MSDHHVQNTKAAPPNTPRFRGLFSGVTFPLGKKDTPTPPTADRIVARDILAYLVAQLPAESASSIALEKELSHISELPPEEVAVTFLQYFVRIQDAYRTAFKSAAQTSLTEKASRTFSTYAGAEFFLSLMMQERLQLIVLQEYTIQKMVKKLLESTPRRKLGNLITNTAGDTVLKGTRLNLGVVDFSEAERVFLSLPSEWLRLANDALLLLTQVLFKEITRQAGDDASRAFMENTLRAFDIHLSKVPAFHTLLRILPAELISAGYLEQMTKGELEMEVEKRTEELSRNTAKLEQLLAENANLTAFPENNPNPILGADTRGTITYHNPATDRLLETLALGTVNELLPSAHFANVQKVLTTGESLRDESMVGKRNYEWLYVPFRDVVHLYASDITDKKRIEQLLEESNAAAKLMIKKEQALTKANSNLADLNAELSRVGKELVARDMALTDANNRLISLDRMKSEFVSVAAHQLRTPLTGIRWTLHSLIDKEFGPLNEKQDEFVKTALKTVIGAISLINDLLNVARIEEGRFGYSMNMNNLKDLLAQSIERFTPIAHGKGVTLNFETNGAIPDSSFDPEKLTMAFENLIDNAIKYTDAGGVVSVGMFADAERIRVVVSDSGIGIPEVEQKKMFIKFFRAGNAQMFHTAGSGLGLYIVKNIIEKHRGSIAFESKEGKGTIFTVTLPIGVKKGA